MVSAVIPHPDGLPVVLVSIRAKGDERIYSWVGGHVHRDETPEKAVIRELEEELVIDSPRVVRTLERIDTHIDASPWWGHRFDDGLVSYNLLVSVGSAEVGVIDHEELDEACWVPISVLVEEWTKTLPPELRDPAIRAATEAVTPAAGGGGISQFVSQTSRQQRHGATSRPPDHEEKQLCKSTPEGRPFARHGSPE